MYYGKCLTCELNQTCCKCSGIFINVNQRARIFCCMGVSWKHCNLITLQFHFCAQTFAPVTGKTVSFGSSDDVEASSIWRLIIGLMCWRPDRGHRRACYQISVSATLPRQHCPPQNVPAIVQFDITQLQNANANAILYFGFLFGNSLYLSKIQYHLIYSHSWIIKGHFSFFYTELMI